MTSITDMPASLSPANGTSPKSADERAAIRALIVIALLIALVAGATAIWGVPALVMACLGFVPVMFGVLIAFSKP